MGLNRPLHSLENLMEVLQFIENLWNEKNDGDIFYRYPEFSKMEVWLLNFQKKKTF